MTLNYFFLNHHNIKGSFVRIRVCNGKQCNGECKNTSS